MAKRRKKSKQDQRYTSVSPKAVSLLIRKSVLRSPDVLGDDRRRWSPVIDSYKMIDGRGVDYEGSRDHRNMRRNVGMEKIAFVHPDKVVVCRKRKERRAALFRQQKIGKGKKVSKRRIMRDSSRIKC